MWNGCNVDGPKNGWVYDADRRSFLLQLDLQQQLKPVHNSNLISCKDNNGPHFGWKDLHIGDNCNT